MVKWGDGAVAEGSGAAPRRCERHGRPGPDLAKSLDARERGRPESPATERLLRRGPAPLGYCRRVPLSAFCQT